MTATMRYRPDQDPRLLTRLPAVSLRATGSEDDPTVDAVVCVYDVVDDYGTIFAPGCFSESLKVRKPVMAWGHDWREPIGRWEDYTDSKSTLILHGRLDDFDAVPRARQAFAQLKSGTIDEFSVGFAPEEWDENEDEVLVFTHARLDEVSLVLAGAVPGTELLGLRNARQMKARLQERLDLAIRNGDVDLAATSALKLLTHLGIDYTEPDGERSSTH